MDGHVWSNERKTPNGAGQCACALVGGLILMIHGRPPHMEFEFEVEPA